MNMDIDIEAAVRHLGQAAAQLATARLALGVQDAPEPPMEALDEALSQDDRYGQAKAAFRKVVEDLPSVNVQHDLEAAFHAAAAAAVDLGWAAGWRTSSG